MTYQFKRKRPKNVTFRHIFNFSNFRYLKPNGLCGWNQLSRVGRVQDEPGRPRLVRPVAYSNHGPKPDPACEIPILPTVGQARFATFHLAGSLSGLVCDIFPSFSRLSSTCGSSSLKFRGHNLLVRPRPAVCLGSCPVPTSGVRRRDCQAPIPTLGYRWCAWVA